MAKNTYILLLICTFIAVSVSQRCITVYQDYDGEGAESFTCKNGDVPAEVNDQISSITVEPGYTATFFQDYNFTGKHITLYEGDNNLDEEWNDQISSVVIYKTIAPQFYRDYNLQNLLFTLSANSNVQAKYNDQVSSIFVPDGFLVTIYPDYSYKGTGYNIPPGVWQAPVSFNDKISSVKVVNTRGCPIFFLNYDLQGIYFIMCQDGNIPNGNNDKVSAIYLPPDYAMTIYADFETEGNYLDIEPGLWLAPAEWNDQISSVLFAQSMA